MYLQLAHGISHLVCSKAITIPRLTEIADCRAFYLHGSNRKK